MKKLIEKSLTESSFFHKIVCVFSERGDCSFVSKTIKAQEAGALAAIISDIDEKNDELYVSMVDDTTERTVKIPSAYLLGKNG